MLGQEKRQKLWFVVSVVGAVLILGVSFLIYKLWTSGSDKKAADAKTKIGTNIDKDTKQKNTTNNQEVSGNLGLEKGSDKRTGITWVEIKGGSFQMGSKSGESDEKPIHHVQVKTFWMAKSEVTVDQYKKCVEAGWCTKPKTGTNYNWGKPGLENHPVNGVSWKDAKKYATWAKGRLPSEAEWEYAARSGGKAWKYPWGNAKATCARAVMVGNGGLGCGRTRTWSVCSRTRGNTVQGLCDMAGNVSEWVEDRYHDTYKGAPSDGSAWVEGSGSYRVYRGGSWRNGAWSLGAARRDFFPPGYRYSLFGFRVVRSSYP